MIESLFSRYVSQSPVSRDRGHRDPAAPLGPKAGDSACPAGRASPGGVSARARAGCGAVLVGEWWPWVQRRFPVAARYYVSNRPLAPGGSLRLSLGIRSCARGEPRWGTPSASARTGTSDSARRRGLVPSPYRCGRRCRSRAQRRSTRGPRGGPPERRRRRPSGRGRPFTGVLLRGFPGIPSRWLPSIYRLAGWCLGRARRRG